MLVATTSTVRGAGGATGAGAGCAGGGCATASGCGAGGAGGWECAQAVAMIASTTGTGTDRMVHSPFKGAIACASPLAIGKSNAGTGKAKVSPSTIIWGHHAQFRDNSREGPHARALLG